MVIISGGGFDFLRLLAEEVYGISPDPAVNSWQFIEHSGLSAWLAVGCFVMVKFETRESQPVTLKLPGFLRDLLAMEKYRLTYLVLLYNRRGKILFFLLGFFYFFSSFSILFLTGLKKVFFLILTFILNFYLVRINCLILFSYSK